MLIQKQYNKLILQEIYIDQEICFTLSKEVKKIIIDFPQGTVKEFYKIYLGINVK